MSSVNRVLDFHSTPSTPQKTTPHKTQLFLQPAFREKARSKNVGNKTRCNNLNSANKRAKSSATTATTLDLLYSTPQKTQINHAFKFPSQSPDLILEIPSQPSSCESLSFPHSQAASQSSSVSYSYYSQTFDEHSVIGSGSFGEVTRVQHRIDKQFYAIKKLKKPRGPRELQIFSQEAKILAECTIKDFPNIIKYFNSWMEDDCMCIQTEWCEKGSVKNLNIKWNESRLADLVVQVSNGLSHMHQIGIAHLDIKMENIFVTFDDIYKIGDFGLSTYARRMGRISSDPGYCSPVSQGSQSSVMEGDSRYLSRDMMLLEKKYLLEADIFALGCSVYELALGRDLPNNGDEWHEIRNGIFQVTNVPLGSEFSKILYNMMLNEPMERPKASELAKSRILIDLQGNKLEVELFSQYAAMEFTQ